MPEGTTWPTAWPSPLRETQDAPVSRGVRLRAGRGMLPIGRRPRSPSTSSRLFSKSRRHHQPARPDRYLFLETLTSTQDRLYLSYRGPGRPDRRGTREPPPSFTSCSAISSVESQGQADAGTWILKSRSAASRELDRFTAPVPSIAAPLEARGARAPPSFRTHSGPAATMTSEALWRLEGPHRDWLGLLPPTSLSPRQSRPSTRLIEVSLP